MPFRLPGRKRQANAIGSDGSIDATSIHRHGALHEKSPVDETPRSDSLPPVTMNSDDELNDTEAKIEGIEEEQQEYPASFKLAMITIALCLSVFCMALDNTIIATAIPRITDEFKALNDVGWYGSAYLLTTCAFQLFFGKLYTYLNLKWVYLIALGIFELG
ncbi:hypothetical protein LTR28_000224, partial [Elasticomyces elasticus]